LNYNRQMILRDRRNLRAARSRSRRCLFVSFLDLLPIVNFRTEAHMTVFYIVIAVLVLLIGVFSYLNAATWNVLHVLGMFLTFGAAFAYLVLASAVLRTETSWKRTAEQLTRTLEDQREKVELLERGLAVNQR